ncbi:MAG TPA: peptide chain release factor N(5)-glutamine methyltransferase [Candidatus Paceibacterota bacterium]|nr:peptide chain release factor N(5)-glutamine methyltransferase [Candidatus Paceibacterota bacterium]
MTVPPEDIRALVCDKYDGDSSVDTSADIARLEQGEPLAYVIGWIPFHGCRIGLSSHPLIPRAETEFWTEKLIAHLVERFGDTPFTLLDLCAGSGAIGIAVLKSLPNASVTFAELIDTHVPQIRENVHANDIDAERTRILVGDLFNAVPHERFDVIATNPPYVPSVRTLDASVIDHEPAEALFSGSDGLLHIQRILEGSAAHLLPGGELWLECDIVHAEEVRALAITNGARSAAINDDQYGRPRYLVSYYP